MQKVRGRVNRQVRADSPMTDEVEVLLAQQTRRMGDKQENEEDLFFLNSKGPPTVGSPTSRTCGR
jgi:hypothetical protein